MCNKGIHDKNKTQLKPFRDKRILKLQYCKAQNIDFFSVAFENCYDLSS